MSSASMRYDCGNVPKEKMESYLMYQRVIWCIIIVLTMVAMYCVCDVMWEDASLAEQESAVYEETVSVE